MPYLDHSRYDLTYNKAIDMVAACVGHSKRTGMALKEIRLNPHFYTLFKKGTEVLAKQQLPFETQLEFEGIPVVKHESVSGFVKMLPVYWNNAFNDPKKIAQN